MDFKRHLEERYGIPQRAAVLVGSPYGLLEPLPGASEGVRPPDNVVLKGVASFREGHVWRHLLEEDMLQACGELNQLYEQPDFQEEVRKWQEAALGDATARVKNFRSAITAARAKVLPKFGFDASPAGIRDWERAVERFARFPTLAELCRKNKVLLGMLTPEQARRAQREAMGLKALAPDAGHTSRHRNWLEVVEIFSEQALVAQRGEADEVFRLLHNRIYEENRQSLWCGGNVPGHEIPTCKAMARKYLEPPGTTILRCVAVPSSTAAHRPKATAVVGGAVLFPLVVRAQASARLDFGTGFQAIPGPATLGGGGGGGGGDGAKVEREGNDESREDDALSDGMGADSDSSGGPGGASVLVGYVNALAALPGSHAGSALLERVEEMAAAEEWDLLALHSIGVPGTLAFWPRKGFRAYGPGKGDLFRFACLQNCGVALEKDSFERQLPPRPGCLLFVKWLSKVTYLSGAPAPGLGSQGPNA